MDHIRKILPYSVLIITGIITGALIWFSSYPTYVLQISIVPGNSSGIKLNRDQKIVIYKGKEPVFFDIAGSVENPIISSVLVSLCHPEAKAFNPPDTFRISKTYFSGRIELVSSGSSIPWDVSYTYKINSGDDNSFLSDGNIQLQVKGVISGTSPWGMLIVGGIGLFAALLQIFELITKKGKVMKSDEAN